MHTIQTIAVITPEHELVIRGMAPVDLPPGEHQVVVTIESGEPAPKATAPLFRSPYAIGLTDPPCTFSREEIYEDVDR